MEIQSAVKRLYFFCKKPEIFIPFFISLITIIYIYFFIKDSFTVWPGDALAYWELSQSSIVPGKQWVYAIVPYSYRIVIPTLVRIFFGSSIIGYIFITISSFFISNFLIFKISQLYTKDILASSFLILAFSSNWTIAGSVANVCLLDLPSFACILLILYILFSHLKSDEIIPISSWIAYSLILILGTLIKEWILFFVPIFLLYFLYNKKYSDSIKLLMFSLPAIASHAIMRLLMGPFFTKIQSFDISLLIKGYITFQIGTYRQLFSTFGAVWLLIPFALYYCLCKKPKLNEMYILPLLGLIAGLFLSCMALEENRYIFFTMFPVLIPAFSLYLSKLNRGLNTVNQFLIISGIFYISRLLLRYRPVPPGDYSYDLFMQDPFWYTFVSVMTAIQILAVLYYLLVGDAFQFADINPPPNDG